MKMLNYKNKILLTDKILSWQKRRLSLSEQNIKLFALMLLGVSLISSLYFVLAQTSDITSSATFMFDENNKLNYKFDWGETEISLYKQINNEYTIFNNNYIEQKEDGKGWKFGADDSSMKNEKANYKYVLSSTEQLVLLEKQGSDEKGNNYNYPVVYNYHPNLEDEWNEFRHIYNFKEVCLQENANCEWSFNENSLKLYFTSDGNIDPTIENVSTCRTLDSANTTYQLTQSLNTTEDCIVVTAYNVTFELQGYNIIGDNSSEDYGIEGSSDYLNVRDGYIYNFGRGIYSSSDYITIENANINSNGYGIYFSGNNNALTNLTLNNNSYGIVLLSSSNNILNDITLNSNTAYGIYIYNSSDNILTSTISNSDFIGVALFSSSNTTLINNNIWNCQSSFYSCLQLDSSDNNTISGGIINKSNSDLIILTNSSNNLFSELELYEAIKNDTTLISISINNTFLNASYELSKEYVSSDSELIRKWYYRAYVNDTSGEGVYTANVTAYDIFNNYQFSLLTSFTLGFHTQTTELLDYINNGTKTHYGEHTIYADKICYPSLKESYNITQEKTNLEHVLTLGSSTYKNWEWNFEDSCALSNINYNIENFNTTSYGSGTWTIDNVTIITSNFDLNSSENWSIEAREVRLIGV